MLDVRDFGARGNGITDDAPAIQKAIDACPFGGTVLLPAGAVYRLEDNEAGSPVLKINKALRLAGQGNGSRIVVASTVSPNNDVIGIVPPANTQIEFACVENITIYPEGGKPARHALVIDTRQAGSTVAKLRVENVFISKKP